MAEKKLTSGSWNGDSTLQIQGGQRMHFKIKNVNILGTNITISANTDETQTSIILPLSTVDIIFTVFAAEPTWWSFDISSSSDVFIVTWELFSTWIPGDPPNG